MIAFAICAVILAISAGSSHLLGGCAFTTSTISGLWRTAAMMAVLLSLEMSIWRGYHRAPRSIVLAKRRSLDRSRLCWPASTGPVSYGRFAVRPTEDSAEGGRPALLSDSLRPRPAPVVEPPSKIGEQSSETVYLARDRQATGCPPVTPEHGNALSTNRMPRRIPPASREPPWDAGSPGCPSGR